MKYYPVNLDIKNQNCLVVGGGAVAFRKVKTLADCGAVVTVVSPEFCNEFQEFKKESRVRLIQRRYQPSDLDEKFLVIGATDDEGINRRISADAKQKNILCNIADLPDACSFILPAVVEQGDLVISVSTSGKSPAFAKRLRKELEKKFGDEYARFLKLMGAVRQQLLRAEHAPEAHKPQLEKLIAGGLLEMIENNQKDEINRLLFNVLGPGYVYDRLMEPED
jgi:precorrin-2 dehydrogenase / sirohydrochlorin ferrochelatase